MAYSKSFPFVAGYPSTYYRKWTGLPVFNGWTIYGQTRTMLRSGQRVEGFKNLIRQKRDASSPYSFTRYVIDAEPALSAFTAVSTLVPNDVHDATYIGAPGSNQSFATVVTPNENAALSKVYQRIRETRSEMNGLAFFGELRETLRMIRRPATTLASGVASWTDKVRDIYNRDVRLQGRRNRSRFTAVVHDTYLEAMFGLLPAVSDVSSLAESLGRLATDDEMKLRLTRVRAKSLLGGTTVPEMLETVDPAWPFTGINASRMRWERRKGSTAEVRWLVFLESQFSSDLPEDLFFKVARITGVTFENVVPALYELTPYSWLVDYFTNLGKVVEAQFTDTSSFKFGVKTVVQSDWVEVLSFFAPDLLTTYLLANNYRPTSLSGYGGKFRETRIVLNRTVHKTLPMPHLQFNLPNSRWKWGNVAALGVASLNRLR